MRTFLESFHGIQDLEPNSKLKDIIKHPYLRVYRSSARPEKNDYISGSHAGTKQQALIRADYMINDEGRYDTYYLYKLIIRVENVYPELLPDDGTDHGYEFVKDLNKYDIAFYKNTGEGDIRNENLSVIIINPDSVVESKMIEKIDGAYLDSIQDQLY